jgi:hypothetical protein
METGQPEGNPTTTQSASEPTPATIAALSDDALKAKIAAKQAGPDVRQDTPTADPAKPPESRQAPAAKPGEEDQRDKNLAEARSMIGRQGTEIGLLRAKVAELQKETLSLKAKGATPPADDPELAAKNQKFIENPIAALDEELEKREKAKQESVTAEKTAIKANFEAVTRVFPGEEIHELMPFMFQTALDDGVPEDVVIEFAKNPFKTPPEAVIALARRAKAEMELKKLKNGNRAEAGKPAGKGGGPPLVTLTSQSGQSSTAATEGLTRSQIADMSDEELKAYRAEMKRKARLG